MHKGLINDFVMTDNDYILSAVIRVRRNITILSDWKVLNMDLASVTKFNDPILTHCYHCFLNLELSKVY